MAPLFIYNLEEVTPKSSGMFSTQNVFLVYFYIPDIESHTYLNLAFLPTHGMFPKKK